MINTTSQLCKDCSVYILSLRDQLSVSLLAACLAVLCSTCACMICRLPENILHRYALDYFTSASLTSTSWFSQIRKLCLFYDLPHPIVLLQEPHTKLAFKSLVKKRVISYWEQTLRHEATLLPSLTYFKPGFMSLIFVQPLWTTAGSSPMKRLKLLGRWNVV